MIAKKDQRVSKQNGRRGMDRVSQSSCYCNSIEKKTTRGSKKEGRRERGRKMFDGKNLESSMKEAEAEGKKEEERRGTSRMVRWVKRALMHRQNLIKSEARGTRLEERRRGDPACLYQHGIKT